jgi:hypothetical protein
VSKRVNSSKAPDDDPTLIERSDGVVDQAALFVITDGKSVTFKVKNYRAEGRARYTTMTLDVAEFIRRFLIHVLPKGFHRIRHYGFLASAAKAASLPSAREKLNASVPHATTSDTATADADTPSRCPCCGGRMITIETFARGQTPHHQPSPTPSLIRIDTS